MSKEVMKLALSTLEGWANYDDWVWPESALEQAKRNTIEAITALRQALVDADDTSQKRVDEMVKTEHDKQIEIAQAYERGWNAALAQRQWVPEALRLADALDAEFVQGRISNHNGRKAAVELRRLALKQWVGLTDDEIQDLSHLSQKIDASNAAWFDRWGFARAIEQALKEKNQ
jgi:hypothetical protein